MGFYFKLAPGVRVRANSRGLRASVGPRAARVHFGAGRTGVSTGVGPVSLYRSTGAGRKRSGGARSSQTSGAAYERQLRQAEKLEQARDLLEAFEHIMNIHRQEFAPASAPFLPMPEPVDEEVIRHQRERDALHDLSVFQRSARAAAKQQAAQLAEHEIKEQRELRRREHAELRVRLEADWRRLQANDPDVVISTLTDAFEDNEARAVPVGVHGDEASLVMLAPPLDLIPEAMPKRTDAGNLSLAKMTKADRNSFYMHLVCGHVLVTVRETLAVAPSIDWVRIAAVRVTPPNAYGRGGVECLLAVLFKREALDGIQWHRADAIQIVNDAAVELSIRQGRATELLPLDLSEEPALAALVQAVEVDDDDGDETDTAVDSWAARLPANAPPQWQPRPGWGTIRDFEAIPNDHGGTDVRCRFVPDDGSEPVVISSPDGLIPELGEYARGILRDSNTLTVKVPPAIMVEVEQNISKEVNEMEPMKRALLYAQGNDVFDDCGWRWTPDYTLVKAATGLIQE